MLKVLIGGVAIGVANIIPGVSGGTMMVVLGIFHKVMEAISGLFSKNCEKRKDYLVFLLVLGIGAVIGLVAFANMLEILFEVAPIQTMYCFVGMIVCSIPTITKTEMKNEKVRKIPLYLGCALVFAITFLAPSETEMVVTEFPELSALYLLMMFAIGAISGGAMCIPGVSGSMLLLIIGQYYFCKSLLVNVTSFELNIIISLVFMGMGIVVGIVVSSKIAGYFLRTRHEVTMNFILGLVIASSIALIPLNETYDLFIVITSIIALVIGGMLVMKLEKLA